MGLIIDTSVLISYERGHLDVEPLIAGREDTDFFLSVISASELLHGVERAADATIRARRSAWVDAVLAAFPIRPIDLATARSHANLWAELSARGELIGPHDMWIAASALSGGLGLATANAREFRRVPGLIVEDWS